MIRLDEKTQQDFLNREWVKRIQDAGIDMSDAKYIITECEGRDCIAYIETVKVYGDKALEAMKSVPTYTLSELLYKLDEYLFWKNDGGEECSSSLKFLKDAPFYFWFYRDNNNKDCIESSFEHPIESAASLLIQCAKKGYSYVKDISGKE